jgi:hypothetical protein
MQLPEIGLGIRISLKNVHQNPVVHLILCSPESKIKLELLVRLNP